MFKLSIDCTCTPATSSLELACHHGTIKPVSSAIEWALRIKPAVMARAPADQGLAALHSGRCGGNKASWDSVDVGLQMQTESGHIGLSLGQVISHRPQSPGGRESLE